MYFLIPFSFRFSANIAEAVVSRESLITELAAAISGGVADDSRPTTDDFFFRFFEISDKRALPQDGRFAIIHR